MTECRKDTLEEGYGEIPLTASTAENCSLLQTLLRVEDAMHTGLLKRKILVLKSSILSLGAKRFDTTMKISTPSLNFPRGYPKVGDTEKPPWYLKIIAKDAKI